MSDAPHRPGPHDDGDPPELDPAELAGLRALLREEPVEQDDLARERRIRAALAAAEVPDAGAAPSSVRPDAPAAVPRPRRSGAPGWLVAAAVVAVLAIGAGLFASVAGQGGQDDEAATVAADAADSGAEADRAPAEGLAGGSAPASTVTTAADQFAGDTSDAVGDLGTFDTAAALLAALDAGLDRTGEAAPQVRDGGAATESPCLVAQLATGVDVVGTATVAGRTVVVVRLATGPVVLDGEDCTPSP